MFFRPVFAAVLLTLFSCIALLAGGADGDKVYNKHVCYKFREKFRMTYLYYKERGHTVRMLKIPKVCDQCMLWRKAFLESDGQLPVNATTDEILAFLSKNNFIASATKKQAEEPGPVEEKKNVNFSAEAKKLEQQRQILNDKMRFLRNWEERLTEKEEALRKWERRLRRREQQ